jgi:hypothetical protein
VAFLLMLAMAHARLGTQMEYLKLVVNGLDQFGVLQGQGLG